MNEIATYIRNMEIALSAAELGARPNVAAAISGLSMRQMARLYAGFTSRPGPSAQIHLLLVEAPILCRIEISIFAALFERLRVAGHDSARSLITAFTELELTYQPLLHDRGRRERGRRQDCLTFDRAFHVAADLHVACPSDGAPWVRSEPRLRLLACPKCRSRTLSIGDEADCSVCRLAARFYYDPRARHFVATAESRAEEFRKTSPLASLQYLMARPPQETGEAGALH